MAKRDIPTKAATEALRRKRIADAKAQTSKAEKSPEALRSAWRRRQKALDELIRENQDARDDLAARTREVEQRERVLAAARDGQWPEGAQHIVEQAQALSIEVTENGFLIEVPQPHVAGTRRWQCYTPDQLADLLRQWATERVWLRHRLANARPGPTGLSTGHVAMHDPSVQSSLTAVPEVPTGADAECWTKYGIDTRRWMGWQKPEFLPGINAAAFRLSVANTLAELYTPDERVKFLDERMALRPIDARYSGLRRRPLTIE